MKKLADIFKNPEEDLNKAINMLVKQESKLSLIRDLADSNVTNMKAATLANKLKALLD